MTFTEYNPVENTAFVYVTGLIYDEWGMCRQQSLKVWGVQTADLKCGGER